MSDGLTRLRAGTVDAGSGGGAPRGDGEARAWTVLGHRVRLRAAGQEGAWSPFAVVAEAGGPPPPRHVFAELFRVCALLASPSGRAFARRDLEARTATLERALAPVTAEHAPKHAAALVALVQGLDTATLWATLVDHRGVDGAAAGRIAARGLAWLLSGSRRRSA